MSNKIRVIEYEFLYWEELELTDAVVQMVEDRLGRMTEVGVLRCTDRAGAKVTIIGGVEACRGLISNENAGRPGGVPIAKSAFPVIIDGWLYRTGEG
jgi:hypothetical protein